MQFQFFGGGNGYPGYAPAAAGNNPSTYAAFVAGQTGIDPNTPLNQIGTTDPTADTSTVDASVFDTGSITDVLGSIDPLWIAGAAAVGVALWAWAA